MKRGSLLNDQWHGVRVMVRIGNISRADDSKQNFDDDINVLRHVSVNETLSGINRANSRRGQPGI